jgi:hypothetical protein
MSEALDTEGMLYLLILDFGVIEVREKRHLDRKMHPWVARILGLSTRYGLEREFIGEVRDYTDAHCARSGRVSGVTATFALREGWVIEYQRVTKRGLTRSFARVTIDGLVDMSSEEVLRWAAAQTR